MRVAYRHGSTRCVELPTIILTRVGTQNLGSALRGGFPCALVGDETQRTSGFRVGEHVQDVIAVPCGHVSYFVAIVGIVVSRNDGELTVRSCGHGPSGSVCDPTKVFRLAGQGVVKGGHE